MTPSNLAKSLGAKSLAEVARAYDTHQSYLTRLHDSDQPRLERMIKVHVLAKKMSVDTKHLQFMLEHVTDTLKQTNAADYFINQPDSREELVRAYVVDFRVRMHEMCEKLLTNEDAKSDFKEVVYGLVMGVVNNG